MSVNHWLTMGRTTLSCVKGNVSCGEPSVSGRKLGFRSHFPAAQTHQVVENPQAVHHGKRTGPDGPTWCKVYPLACPIEWIVGFYNGVNVTSCDSVKEGEPPSSVVREVSPPTSDGEMGELGLTEHL